MAEETIKKQSPPEELLPKEKSEELGPRVYEILNDILNYRENLEKPTEWTRYYELRRNKHWKHKQKGSVKLVSANMVGTHHQKTVNMLTANKPTFNVVQAGEIADNAEEQTGLVNNMIVDFWSDREQQHVFEASVSNGEIYGNVAEFGSYDPDINFPEGDVEFESIEPYYYGLYPVKCREIEKCEAFVRWYPKTVREGKRLWPKVADKIESDSSLIEKIDDTRLEQQEGSRQSVYKTVYNSLQRFLSKGKASRTDGEEFFVIEIWAKDYTEVNGKAKYTGNVRRVRVCNGGSLVLSDDDNPSINKLLPEEVQQASYLYNRFPASHTQSVTDTASTFGMSDFEQLESLNIEVNKSISQLTMYKDKAARLKLINPKDSGVTNEELDNAPGIINPTNYLVAQSIGYVQPPTMPVDITASLSVYREFFHEIAGTFQDKLQGADQGANVIAYKAIAALLEEASRMLKGKISNYSKMIRERGRMWLSLAQNFYDSDRFITVKKNGKEETIPVNRDKLQIPVKLNVVNGSTMPVSLVQKREEAISLYQLRAIDQEELLKAVDWDNWREVINRMQQGPIGQFLQKLAMIGVPQPMLQIFQKVSTLDEKEIEKAIENEDIPQFGKVILALAGQQPKPEPTPEQIEAQIKVQSEQVKMQNDTLKTQADVEEIKAKIRKIDSEIQLNIEKSVTEKIEQQVKAKGVEFDEEKLKMQRAELVDKIKSNEQDRKIGKVDAVIKTGKEVMGDIKPSAQSSKQGPYSERGLQSNNIGQ